MSERIRVAIVTVSDKASRGERADAGGPALRAALPTEAFAVVDYRVVPDERDQIAGALRQLTGRHDVDVVLTTGGTGLAPRDVTPQATLEVVEYQVPGIAEQMRAESVRITPAAMLSRGVAGVSRQTLVVNLPGSPKGACETLAVILPALPHAVSTLRGEVGEHQRPT